MILEIFGLPETPTNQFISLVLGGLVFYFGMSGLSYLIFFVWGRKKFHPTYQPNPTELREAYKWGTLGVLGNAVLTLPFHLAIAHGWSRVYWHLDDHGGLPWLLASFAIYLVFTETCIYWIHRWLHTVPFLYTHLHHIHHKWKTSTSWVSMAFHPLDSFAQALPHHLIVFLLPVNGWIYLGMVAFVSLWSVLIHDRVSFVRWWWVNNCDHHTVHHWCYDFNYGQFTNVWDRLMGSWRDPRTMAQGDPGLREAMWQPRNAPAEGAVPAE